MVKVKLLWAMLPKIKQGKTSFLGAFKLGEVSKQIVGLVDSFVFRNLGGGGEGGRLTMHPERVHDYGNSWLHVSTK